MVIVPASAVCPADIVRFVDAPTYIVEPEISSPCKVKVPLLPVGMLLIVPFPSDTSSSFV